MTEPARGFDIVIVGGGIFGCAAALRLARRGMHVALLERSLLCAEASGRNAGTLSLQYPRPVLTEYAIRGREYWQRAAEWLGAECGYVRTGGLVVAFNEAEAARLEAQSLAKRDAGCAIELVGGNRARELEPGLNGKVVLASWCADDGFADSNRLGTAMRGALAAAGVAVQEGTTVTEIAASPNRFEAVTAAGVFRAPRLLVACGVWNGGVAAMLGVKLVVGYRRNQVVVTERMPPIATRVLGVANGRLSLKQKRNGTILIGGGWEGEGGPEDPVGAVVRGNLLGNLRLAEFAYPALREARVVRTWFGVRDHLPDYLPLAGPAPGMPGAWLISCGVSGFTVGPALGTELADRIIEERGPISAFDPARFAPAVPA